MQAMEHTAETRACILIVEDERIIARDVETALEDLGYEIVGVASSGAEALAALGSKVADIVLMDIKIRGDMDGIQTAEQIKTRFRLPIIYLTAHTDRSTLERARASQPFGYIVKPFKIGDMKIAIEAALRQHTSPRKIKSEGESPNPAQ